MSSNSNHDADSAKPAKQDGTASHSHDSIGARVGEGISYVRFLTGVCTNPRMLNSIVIHTVKISGAMKLIHGITNLLLDDCRCFCMISPDDRCAR
jgi:hypothetical protein